ncbi:MAG: hypothetical protein LBH77_07725 [Tannerella sp.]|jgi:hypothetical protein|nr:hypothetical protein [Tannerella sp.]
MRNLSIPVFIKYILVGISSVWIVGCGSVAPVAVKRTAAATLSDRAVWNATNRSDREKNSYRMVLKTPDNSITGICILKKNGDEWRGTLINEMGAKAFDFIVTDKECTLLNVISMMNKWYIKKTVAADLYFFLNVDNPKVSFYKNLERFEQGSNLIAGYGKRWIMAKPDGSILWINNRRNLQYEWKKMIEIDPDKIIE